MGGSRMEADELRIRTTPRSASSSEGSSNRPPVPATNLLPSASPALAIGVSLLPSGSLTRPGGSSYGWSQISSHRRYFRESNTSSGKALFNRYSSRGMDVWPSSLFITWRSIFSNSAQDSPLQNARLALFTKVLPTQDLFPVSAYSCLRVKSKRVSKCFRQVAVEPW